MEVCDLWNWRRNMWTSWWWWSNSQSYKLYPCHARMSNQIWKMKEGGCMSDQFEDGEWCEEIARIENHSWINLGETKGKSLEMKSAEKARIMVNIMLEYKMNLIRKVTKHEIVRHEYQPLIRCQVKGLSCLWCRRSSGHRGIHSIPWLEQLPDAKLHSSDNIEFPTKRLLL